MLARTAATAPHLAGRARVPAATFAAASDRAGVAGPAAYRPAQMTGPGRLALEGVRVLDLSRLLPGGFCSLLLADHGADV